MISNPAMLTSKIMRYKYNHCLLAMACVWSCVACNSVVITGTGSTLPSPVPQPPAPDQYEIYTYAEFPDATGNLSHVYPLYEYKYGDIAAQVTSGLNQLPVGRRGLMQWGQEFRNGDIQLTGNPLDMCVNGGVATNYQCPWLNNGTALLKPQFQNLYDSLKQSGATVDAAIFDSEPDFINFWTYENYLLNPASTPSWLPSAIDQDPRFSTMLVPALQALYATGPTSYPANQAPNLPSVETLLGGGLLNGRYGIELWQEYSNETWYVTYGRQAIYGPILQDYPQAIVSDFGAVAHNINYPAYDLNGWRYHEYGYGFVGGNAQAPALYGYIGGFGNGGFNPTGQTYYATGFNALRFDQNNLRGFILGAAANAAAGKGINYPATPWIPYKSYGNSLYFGNDYYQESIYHSALNGVRTFLTWNPAGTGPNDNILISKVLTELNSLLGDGPRTSLTNAQTSWTSNYIITSMQTPNGVISRLTPSEGMQVACVSSAASLACTLTCPASLNCTDATSCRAIQSNGFTPCNSAPVTLQFANGTQVTPAEVNSSAGFWLAQPSDSTPPH